MKKFNNSSVLNLAVANAIKGADFDSSRVIELLNYAGKSSIDDMLRGIYYLTGQLDMPNPASFVKNNKGRILQFKSYNIFEDRLGYEYDATDYRCFRTQAEAERYEADGEYDWNNSKSTCEPTEAYPFLGTRKYRGSGSCCLDTWESYSVAE